MATFGPGLLVEPVTLRPAQGRVVEVLHPDTEAPVTTAAPVVAGPHGTYGPFTTVGDHADVQAVIVRRGDVQDTVPSLEALAAAAAAPVVTATDGVITITTGA